MTKERMIELLEIEHECMLRGSHDDCDRKCEDCKLVQDDGELHEMYTNVIGIVKDSDPHVMTISELEDALDTVVWLDSRGVDENSSEQYRLITAYSHKGGWFKLRNFNGYEIGIGYNKIGVAFRFWNRRPYDEQRKAVPWT